MSEDRPDYLSDAAEMLGKGYEPAATIESPRIIRELTDKGLQEYKAWGWVKVSAKFIGHIRILRGAKLAIWQCVALSIDENGICKLTIKDLERMTGYGHTEIVESLKELKELGYLGISKTTKGNIYHPEFAARGASLPSENAFQKVESAPAVAAPAEQNHSTSSEENSVSTFKELKELINTLKGIFMQTDLSPDELARRIKKAIRDASGKNPSSREFQAILDVLIEENKPMHKAMKTEAFARGYAEKELELSEKVADAFGFSSMPLTPQALDVYRWIEEQEKQGCSLEKFVEWARGNDEGKYIRMYRNDPANIRVDWHRAFSAKTQITKNADGSLYV